ncbi:hypothetical protein [Microvirga roseola]|uniref:hypothetical protein n=1 Tax=Microvirga roseola TaxID=2883126 RepID=UPI001E6399FA|nr:hypothetical protein [Microvirga roseola]
MNDVTIMKISRWAACLLLASVAVFTLAPIGFRPDSGLPPPVERFAGIALITTLFCLGYPRYRLAIVAVMVVAVGAMEVAQDMIPGRHGKWYDLIVKESGVLLGAALAFAASGVTGRLQRRRPRGESAC